MVFIIRSQGFIFSKWVSLERNSSSFLFLGIEFDFRAGFLSKNGGILLSGGRGRMWEVSELLTERWMCCQIWRQGLCPQGLLLPGLFLLFLSVSLEVVNSSSEVVCPLLQGKKKKKMGGRIMQRRISWWQLYVVVWCGRASCVISTLFLWIKLSVTGEGSLQKEPVSAESKPSVLLPTTDLLFRGRKSPSV